MVRAFVKEKTIGFIGGGNMAFAIFDGLLQKGIIRAEQVYVSGPHIENLKKWDDVGATATTDNYEVTLKADIIFLCVKPHMLTKSVSEIKEKFDPNYFYNYKLFISVLAGVPLAKLEAAISFFNSKDIKIIRTMPNTPLQVGAGCTVYTPGTNTLTHDKKVVEFIFGQLGIVEEVTEDKINAATGLAGSGTAYIYTIIDALADGGVKQGLPRELALKLAAQTVFGAGKMVIATQKHPGVLKDEVCSPGGTTICGIHEIEKGQVRATMINAVEKATERAIELSK